MNYQTGKKVKTRMNHGNINHLASYHHWWIITTIASDHMVLTDSKGDVMVTDKNGKGLCPKQGHEIYKIKQ